MLRAVPARVFSAASTVIALRSDIFCSARARSCLRVIVPAVVRFGVPDRMAAKSMGGPDTLMATLIYAAGPEVRIQGGWFAPETPLSMSFQARADRAELEWTRDGLMLSEHRGQRERVSPEGGDAYDAEIAYFVECCRIEEGPARCMPRDSARALKLALLLKESRAEGGQQALRWPTTVRVEDAMEE